jgi:hypothetical protein
VKPLFINLNKGFNIYIKKIYEFIKRTSNVRVC